METLTLDEQIAQLSETHKQELIAYELTVQNLKIELNAAKESTGPDKNVVTVDTFNEAIDTREAVIVKLKKIVIDIAGEDYLKHKGF